MKMKIISPALFSLALLCSCGGGGSSSASNPVSSPAPTSSSALPSSEPPVVSSDTPTTSSQDPVVSSDIPSSSEAPTSSSAAPDASSAAPASSSAAPTSSSAAPDASSAAPDASSAAPDVSSAPAGARTTYKFEAEYCPCIEDMEGATYSGGTSSFGLIGKDRDGSMNASGGYYVHFMYVQGSILEFNIVSDRDVEDVTFVARFSAEYRDIDFNVDMFPILIDEQGFDYGTISITDVPLNGAGYKAFADFTLIDGLSLHEGVNCIQFVVANNILMYGTALSTAPMIDCIKLTTAANLTWPEEAPENLEQLG